MSDKKELTKEILQMIRDGGKFIKAQAPALAQEVIGEGVFTAIFGLVIAFVFLLVAAVLCIVAVGQDPSKYSGMTTDFLYFIGGISGAIAILVASINMYNLLLIKKFPKLYLYRTLK